MSGKSQCSERTRSVRTPAAATLLLALLWSILPSHASAIFGIGAAKEWTQVLNKVELVKQTTDLGKQLGVATDTLSLLRNNTKILSNPQAWRAYDGALNVLARSIDDGGHTAYGLASADEDFRRRFPEKAADPRMPRYGDAYEYWWRNNRRTVDGILRRVGMRASDFDSQRKGLAKLQRLSRNPESQNKILQVANELAISQSAQIQQLQEIGMQQIELQGHAFTAQEEQKRDKADAMRRALKPLRLYRGNEKTY